MNPSTVVEIGGLTHTFGGSRVLDELALRVDAKLPGELGSSICIVGPNGAGKTTLLNLLTGFLRPLPSARVSVLGHSVHGIGAEEIAVLGVSRSLQGARDVVPELSVRANLFLVPRIRAVPWWWRLTNRRRWTEVMQRAREQVDLCLSEFNCEELRSRLDSPAGELSFGWRRIVSAFRAHLSDAKLIILDEPFAGLDTHKITVVQRLVARWRSQRTVLFVEHIRSSAMRAVIEETASRLVLMDQGRIVLDGAPGDVLPDPSFSRVYTGLVSKATGLRNDWRSASRKEEPDSTLKFSALRASYDGMPVLCGIDASVSPGQHVLIVGPNGAGKSTMLSSVHGIGLEATGEIRLGESNLNRRPAYEVARLGVGFVPQRSRIFDDLSVHRNLSIAASERPSGERKVRIRRALELFPRLRARLKQEAKTLSGGEQTQLALALAMLREPVVLLADEISVGLDAARTSDLMALLGKQVHRGLALMTAEQLYQPALENCTRVFALRNGEVVWQGPPEDFTEKKQAALFAGLEL